MTSESDPVREETDSVVLDGAAWIEELAFIERRAQSTEKPKQHQWPRDDLYEDRLRRLRA